jgi:streptomycin 3"-adenylyltransferase
VSLQIPGAPPEIAGFLDGLVQETSRRLGPDLAGVVLHGSLAMRSYYPPKSDLDLLIIVSDLAEEGRESLYRLLAEHHARRPYEAGLEVSAIRAADAHAPRHRLPYLVHFSESTTGVQAFDGGALPTDPDLVAHLMVGRTRGVSLYGPPPAELIGVVRWADYVAAVAHDIDELLAGEAILAAPRYAVLNLCRWAMMGAADRPLVPSKEEAALWALEHAPVRHRALIAQALAAYRSAEPVTLGEALRLAGGPWDRQALLGFRDWARGLGPPQRWSLDE